VGIQAELSFNPGRWSWNKTTPLQAYSARLGRSLLIDRSSLVRTIPDKWHSAIAADFYPRWLDVWSKARPLKEAGFLWSVYHRAVAVHGWRRIATPQISTECNCCSDMVKGTIVHKFFYCSKTQHTWKFAMSVLYSALATPKIADNWPALFWEQCILGCKIPDACARAPQCGPCLGGQ